MKRYIKLFKAILKINLKNIMVYRANFFLNLVDSLVWFVITIIFFNSIFNILNNINDWNIYEIYILIGISELIKSLIFIFFINNLPYIPTLVNRGTLDYILTKPVNSQFLLSARKLDLGNIGNIVPSIFLIIFAHLQIGQNISVISILYFFILLIFSFLLSYSIWFILMTLSIWFTKVDNAHELFLGVMPLMRYPASIYQGVSRIVFIFVFPIILISNVPAYALLNRFEIFSTLILLVYAIIFFIISIFFWKFALKYYSSAGG
ncbi:MAG: ABC-2 family transporter protein [Defluviitaleaceae bacterium]|nr:ABC-2 family transporter protein [Defluviitaleaceae bacterium]